MDMLNAQAALLLITVTGHTEAMAQVACAALGVIVPYLLLLPVLKSHVRPFLMAKSTMAASACHAPRPWHPALAMRLAHTMAHGL